MQQFMRGMTLTGLLVGFSLSYGAAASLTIDKIAVGTAIDNRTLEGAADTFDASAPRLYCWMRVTAATPPATLKHVWRLNGAPVAEVPLTISQPSMRTWSSKTPAPGAWTVDVQDEAGHVLSSVSFTVK